MTAELKVLVTGFVPFGGDAYNASGVTARPDFDGTGARAFTPNDANAGRFDQYVAQSLINTAIYRAIGAAIAGVARGTGTGSARG